MSGLDPLSLGLSNNVVAAAELAFIEAALDLGVPAEVLQAQLSVGDFLTGTVLPPQNGHDLLAIFGRPVVAQLPPDVRPGETLLLQVSGFSPNRIVVRNLGLYDEQNPVRTVTLQLPQAQTPPAETAVAQTTPMQISPEPAPGRVAPPREVLLAASIRPALTPHNVAASQAAPQRAPQTAPQAAPAVVQRIIRTAGDLLKTIRVPDTPFTRTAAAIAPQAPARLPSVLQRLDAALPRETEDSRIPTLRTLIAFTARMNPANEETLPTQIAAYVSHVIESAETKIQQLLQAHVQAGAAPAAPAPPPAPTQQSQQQPQQRTLTFDASQTPRPAPARPGPAHSNSISAASQARVAERSATAEHDLKSLVLSLLRDPQIARTPTLTQALNETLITLTGTQLNVLSANAQDPGNIAFAVPLFFHEGGKPAYLRIGRDAQSRGGKLDADNFHVAFLLDTANLGTVAIDLESTGRAVKVNVKTEQDAAASRFAGTLESLRARLEDLRYRVTSATAQALKNDKTKMRAHHVQQNAAEGLDLRA